MSSGTIARMPDQDVVERVAMSTGLPLNVAARVVGDVLAYYQEPAVQFVRRRHAELQAAGKKNPEIFTLIADELRRRLVAAPVLSERQLRRVVYG